MRSTFHTHSRRKPGPMEDFLANRQFEADFAVCGEIEYEELDDSDADVELGFLAERVRAARSFGA